MEQVEKIIKNDRFGFETVGAQLLEIKPGLAKVQLEVTPAHLNGLGCVQGGAIFTLADLALAAAANSRGNVAVSINASISYFKAVREGILLACATEDALHSRLGTYTVRVTDAHQVLIAQMQATVYRKKETVDSLYQYQEGETAHYGQTKQ